MLDRLVIHDVVLIEKLALNFVSGLNVFTGETGAGKSIVLDALGLALGGRSDVHLIRKGASQASVSASFNLSDDHPVYALLENQGLSHASPLILRRVISLDGKSRAFINDEPVSIGLLKSVGDQLLEIHGQFETHGLLNPATHRSFLDTYGVLDEPRQKVADLFARWKESDTLRQNAQTSRDRAQAEEDFLRATVAELDDVSPESGEAEKLAEQRTHLQHHEKILEALHAAEQAIESDRGALHSLTLAGKSVARIADKATEYKNLLDTIDRAAQEASEASRQIDHLLHAVENNPNTLQTIEERLFLLRALARKHNVPVDALSDLRRDFKKRLELISDENSSIGSLTKKAEEAHHIYLQHARELHKKRQKAALDLEKSIMTELPPLKLENATFKIDVELLPDDHATADGIDRVAFLASTNAGTHPGNLQKIASGGELSRFMLALKVVLASSNPVPTFVFDELDSGIGGATASAVGERLARLSEHLQILVVTHSPQVAARGHCHWHVRKQTKSQQTTTTVDVLDHDARCEEIARMLAGTHVTDAARKAALSLLDDAPPVAKKSKRIRA